MAHRLAPLAALAPVGVDFHDSVEYARDLIFLVRIYVVAELIALYLPLCIVSMLFINRTPSLKMSLSCVAFSSSSFSSIQSLSHRPIGSYAAYNFKCRLPFPVLRKQSYSRKNPSAVGKVFLRSRSCPARRKCSNAHSQDEWLLEHRRLGDPGKA